MTDFDGIKEAETAVTADLGEIQRLLDRFNADIAETRRDSSRTPAFIAELIESIRAKILPRVAEKRASIKATAKAMQPELTPWSDKCFLLSRQRFAVDRATDAAMKAAHAAQLALMDSALLKLTATEAIRESNLPLIFQCHLASIGTRSDQLHRVDISLDDVIVKEQAEALAALASIARAPARAELLASRFLAAGISPTKKMQLAREANT